MRALVMVLAALRRAGALDLGGSVGVSFTPGGLCYPYQIGVAKVLYEAEVMRPDRPIAGASSGGIVAAIAALSETGAPTIDDTFDAALRINDFCRRRGTARGNLYDALKIECDRLLDDTSVRRLNERAAPVTLAVTRLAPWPKGLFVDEFFDLKDLKQCVLATACIPFYFAKAPCIFYRGAPAVDGVFASPRDRFGAPDTAADATLRVCPFPASRVGLDWCGEAVIAPDPTTVDLAELFACALGDPPVADAALAKLYENGERDARAWLRRQKAA